MKSNINIKVKNKEKNLKIDVLLSNHNDKLSRSRVKNLILENNLKINNIIVTDPSKKVKVDDEVFFKIVEPKKETLAAFKYPLEIIHEDEDLIVINKSFFFTTRESIENPLNFLISISFLISARIFLF